MSQAADPRRKLYVLYDGRAKLGIDTFDCAVLCAAHCEREAWQDSRTFRDVDALWFEYDLKGKTAVNERSRPDIGKGILL